jgi:hypothetical protein
LSGRIAIAALAAAGMSACVSESNFAERSRIRPGSPVAEAVAQVQAKALPYPSFATFPKKPTDLRAPGAWEQGRASLDKSAGELAAVASAPVEMPDPDAYARQARAAAGLDQITPPGPGAAAELDAYARELRERATPPPPPQ